MSRYPLCPCTHVPLDGWCVAHGLWRASTFIALALAITVLQACGTMPDPAYPMPSAKQARVQAAVVAAGVPACPGLAMWVYEASGAERLTRCQRLVPSCLTSANPTAMTTVPLAVVSPESAEAGAAHETIHAIEMCSLGRYDYGHAGPQWSSEARKAAGAP